MLVVFASLNHWRFKKKRFLVCALWHLLKDLKETLYDCRPKKTIEVYCFVFFVFYFKCFNLNLCFFKLEPFFCVRPEGLGLCTNASLCVSVCCEMNLGVAM